MLWLICPICELSVPQIVQLLYQWITHVSFCFKMSHKVHFHLWVFLYSSIFTFCNSTSAAVSLYRPTWPALVEQGTSHRAQVSDFTCTVAGTNMTNTLWMHSIRQNVHDHNRVELRTSYNSMSLINWKYHWFRWLSLTLNTLRCWFVTYYQLRCMSLATCSLFHWNRSHFCSFSGQIWFMLIVI